MEKDEKIKKNEKKKFFYEREKNNWKKCWIKFFLNEI